VVVKTLPERSQTPLNLAHVNVHMLMQGWRVCAYLQLSHRWFTEVLGAGVCAQSDQECAVNPLFFDTALTLLCPQHALLLQLTGFALGLGLAPGLQCRVALGMAVAPANAKER
jgi:hypothetical protein